MYQVQIPKMGASTVEAEIAQWLVSEGDRVEIDTVLAEVESEKATLELVAPVAGTVAQLCVPAHTVVEVGAVVCLIQEG